MIPNNDRKPTVLIVDDSVDTLMILKVLFEAAGANVFTATSGEEALSLMGRSSGSKAKERDATERFDLVILDICMPRMKGYEVAQRMRELPFKGKIVALTANVTGEGREQSKNSGFDIYLGKLTMNKKVAEALVAEERTRESR